MAEEIKEILDDLGDKEKYIEEFGYQYKRISLYDSFQLLDYITNLQQENKRLNNIINTFEDDLERELNISAQESLFGPDKYTVIHSTLEKMLKYFRELKESGNNE